MKRVLIVANTEKPRVANALRQWSEWLRERAEIVRVETSREYDLRQIEADLILVLGGDGTLLSVARRLEGRQIPVMGVNFGRLGFLASFTPADFKSHFEQFLRDELSIRPRQMLEASVLPADINCRLGHWDEVARVRRFFATALNDAVVTAGPPFRMIDLEIAADAEGGIRYSGDGVIVSTSSGSTAYNVSAGGPIISPDVEAFCITPICPHSLSFRPVVVSSQSTVLIVASRVNEGTTLSCDGQASTKLCSGDKVVIRRSEHQVLLVEDPDAREWRSLAEKLNWAAGPRYTEADDHQPSADGHPSNGEAGEDAAAEARNLSRGRAGQVAKGPGRGS